MSVKLWLSVKTLALTALLGSIALAAAPRMEKAQQGGVDLYVRRCEGARTAVRLLLYNHGTAARQRDILSSRIVRLAGASGHVFLSLPEGGYQPTLYDGGCSVLDVEFGVLKGFVRTLDVHMSEGGAPGGSGSVGESYYAPAGDLAGAFPDIGISLRLTRAHGKSYSPIISHGAYYFDGVPAGKYRLELRGSNFSVDKAVSIPENFDLMRVDLPAL